MLVARAVTPKMSTPKEIARTVDKRPRAQRVAPTKRQKSEPTAKTRGDLALEKARQEVHVKQCPNRPEPEAIENLFCELSLLYQVTVDEVRDWNQALRRATEEEVPRLRLRLRRAERDLNQLQGALVVTVLKRFLLESEASPEVYTALLHL